MVVFHIFTFEQKIKNKAAIDLSVSSRKVKDSVLFFRMAFTIAQQSS